MTASELKTRANALMNRLNELGFMKDGQPMVIDQAFELVAAEEGYRNQHVLRTKLDANNPDSEAAAQLDWHSIVACQGWDAESQLTHAMGFIVDQGQMTDFLAYAEKAAADENAFGDTVSAEEISELLSSMGYSLATSDFGKPYWQFECEASVDFADEAAAWEDAWEDAQNRMAQKLGENSAVWAARHPRARFDILRSARLTPYKAGECCSECGRELDLDGWHSLCVDCAGSTENQETDHAARQAADEAYEAYDFGATVVSANGWETCTGWETWTRTVFLENSAPGESSIRVRFTVRVNDGIVTSMAAY